MPGVIYLMRNEVNQKCYIGQTIQDPNRRFMCHIWEAERNELDTKLNRAIIKYGRNSFSFHQLIECNVEMLNTYEIALIRKYNSYENGYNSTIGGQSNGSGSRSDETKEKIRQFQIEYNKRDDVKQRKSELMTGENHHQYGKTGDKSKIFGIIREKTKQNYDKINLVRIEKHEGKKSKDIAIKFEISEKTVNNWCGPDYEHLGTPSTTKCSVRKQSANRTKRTEKKNNDEIKKKPVELPLFTNKVCEGDPSDLSVMPPLPDYVPYEPTKEEYEGLSKLLKQISIE